MLSKIFRMVFRNPELEQLLEQHQKETETVQRLHRELTQAEIETLRAILKAAEREADS